MKDTYNGNDLIQAGFKPGPHFKEMIMLANQWHKSGEGWKETIEKLTDLFPPETPKLQMRDIAAPLYFAIHAITQEEKDNLVGVSNAMNKLLKVPVVLRGAIMPDACPAGSEPATIPVGGVIAVKDAIIPGAHSADICCSMFATFYLPTGKTVAEELDILTGVTRFGPGGREEADWVYHDILTEEFHDHMNRNQFLRGLQRYALMHMGDQGDGNHFAYIGEVHVTPDVITELTLGGYGVASFSFLEVDKTYRVLVTHHGSRGLGAQVYKRGLKVAIDQTNKIAENIPKNAAWIDTRTEVGKEYINALEFVSDWTMANHEVIHTRYISAVGANPFASPVICNPHNFVWQHRDDSSVWLHGKGATPAWKDRDSGRSTLGLIPLNMSEPILVVLGLDNHAALGFAPHGAGRNLSRTALKAQIGDAAAQAAVIKDTTAGIDVRWYSGLPDISETPVAYKNADQVIEQINQFGLAKVVMKIMPLGCIMAGESPHSPFWKKDKKQTL